MEEKFMYKALFLADIYLYFYCADFYQYEIALTDFIDRYYFKYYHKFNLVCETVAIDEKYFCIKLFSTEEELQEVCQFACEIINDSNKMLKVLRKIGNEKTLKINDLAMRFCESMLFDNRQDDVKKYAYGLKQ